MSVEIKETLAVFSRQSFTVIWLEMEASSCCRTLSFSDNSGFRGEEKARVDGRWLEEIKKRYKPLLIISASALRNEKFLLANTH